MKIVVLNGSPRKGGNTEIMTQAFTKGAEKKGHEVVNLPVGTMKSVDVWRVSTVSLIMENVHRKTI